jgi:hypothetical protein
MLAGRFTFPGIQAEWSFEATPSLTVAGPRRICTGLPRYALVGTQGEPASYHAEQLRERLT